MSKVILELCCFEWFQNLESISQVLALILELCCFEWFQNLHFLEHKPIHILELCCFEWFQNLSRLELCAHSVLELCCFEWFQNTKTTHSRSESVLELCCFEWFQPILKATHFLSSFFLIQVYILVVTTPFPCRKAKLRVLRITLPLLTSGWYHTSFFLLELER